jgi:hypothetical protein
MDLAYGSVAQQIMGRYQGLLGLFSSNMTTLWGSWGAFAQIAANTTRIPTQEAALKFVEKIFYGNGLESEFLSSEVFTAKTGRPAMGVWDLMHVTPQQLTSDPENPQAISGLIANLLRSGGTTAFIKAAPGIHAAGAKTNPDNQFVRGIRNVAVSDPQRAARYAFRNLLIADFANKILVPEGTQLASWEYYDAGGRKPGSQAVDASGGPVRLALANALFNHKSQFSARPGVQIKADEGLKDVIALYGGSHDLQEMVLAGIALTQVAPWGGAAGGSDAYDRVLRDRATLLKQIDTAVISPSALEAAKFMVGYLDTLIATGFPTLQ